MEKRGMTGKSRKGMVLWQLSEEGISERMLEIKLHYICNLMVIVNPNKENSFGVTVCSHNEDLFKQEQIL